MISAAAIEIGEIDGEANLPADPGTRGITPAEQAECEAEPVAERIRTAA